MPELCIVLAATHRLHHPSLFPEVRHKKTKVRILCIPSLATLQPGAWCLVQTRHRLRRLNTMETVETLGDADCFYEFLIYYLRPLTAAAAPHR